MDRFSLPGGKKRSAPITPAGKSSDPLSRFLNAELTGELEIYMRLVSGAYNSQRPFWERDKQMRSEGVRGSSELLSAAGK